MEGIPGLLDGIYLISPQVMEYGAFYLESNCVAEGVSVITPDLIENRCRSFLQRAVKNLSAIDYFSKKPMDFMDQSFATLSEEDEEVRIW